MMLCLPSNMFIFQGPLRLRLRKAPGYGFMVESDVISPWMDSRKVARAI